MNADLNFSVLLRKSDLTGIHSQRERQTDRQTDRETYRQIDTDRLALFRPIPNLQVKQLFHQGNRIICHDCFHCHAFFPLFFPRGFYVPSPPSASCTAGSTDSTWLHFHPYLFSTRCSFRPTVEADRAGNSADLEIGKLTQR